jgi:hypothetical protein
MTHRTTRVKHFRTRYESDRLKLGVQRGELRADRRVAFGADELPRLGKLDRDLLVLVGAQQLKDDACALV